MHWKQKIRSKSSPCNTWNQSVLQLWPSFMSTDTHDNHHSPVLLLILPHAHVGLVRQPHIICNYAKQSFLVALEESNFSMQMVKFPREDRHWMRAYKRANDEWRRAILGAPHVRHRWKRSTKCQKCPHDVRTGQIGPSGTLRVAAVAICNPLGWGK